MSPPQFDHPWLLLLLPLALLPLLRAAAPTATYPWLDLIPIDRVSDALGWLVRLLAAIAIAAAVLGLAGPYRPEIGVERVGRGAEVVLLLDRSRSMDQPLYTARRPEEYLPAFGGPSPGSKGSVARRLLAEFAVKRKADMFGMIVFSTFPIPILPFTQKQDMIQAAITAGDIGRGLADTDIGKALLSAAAMFDQRPYSGSRIILLVSDGGAQLDGDTRTRIRNALKRNRIALYWIYIRSFRSPGLSADAAEPQSDAETVPERSLHTFFRSLATPYRAYEAEDPEALQRAIADVNRLENLPIHYREQLPREDLAQLCFGTALAATLGLLLAGVLEVKRWP